MRTLLALSLGVIALVLWRRQSPTATVTTSEGFDLSPYGGETSYPLPIVNAAQAIARAEGFYVPGSIPQRAHNPGNLKLGEPSIAGGITVFDSDDLGWAALYRQLSLIVTGRSRYYSLSMSIADMGRIWTATVAEQGAWSQNVASALGVSVATPLSQVLV